MLVQSCVILHGDYCSGPLTDVCFHSYRLLNPRDLSSVPQSFPAHSLAGPPGARSLWGALAGPLPASQRPCSALSYPSCGARFKCRPSQWSPLTVIPNRGPFTVSSVARYFSVQSASLCACVFTSPTLSRFPICVGLICVPIPGPREQAPGPHWTGG